MKKQRAILMQNISFSFPGDKEMLFDNLNVEIEHGSFVSTIGASGSGKSSFLRLIAGLLKQSKGKIEIEELKPDRTHLPVAYVFQDSRLLPWRTVFENVKFGIEDLGMKKTTMQNRVVKYLRMVKMNRYSDRLPRELSGGQRQMVALARALAVEPDILLMDEPFSHLDAYTRHKLQDELIRIWQKTGKTILFVTHDIIEAHYLSERIITLGEAPKGIIADKKIKAKYPRKRVIQDNI